MVMERMPEGPPSAGPVASNDQAAERALRAQLLATEHWSLLATRSLSWNESFARAGMFLTLLSGAIVALALVAQATAFGPEFGVFALLILPVVLFVGIATYVRLVEINNEDYVWVLGMNRLRRAYLELDPELARHFITGTSDDFAGMMLSYGTQPSERHVLHGLVTTPTTIGFVNAMVAAVLASVLLVQYGMTMVPVAVIGVAVFLATVVILAVHGYRSSTHARTFAALLRKPGPGTGEEEA